MERGRVIPRIVDNVENSVQNSESKLCLSTKDVDNFRLILLPVPGRRYLCAICYCSMSLAFAIMPS